MSLFAATVAVAVPLLAAGIVLLAKGVPAVAALRSRLRSTPGAVVLFGGAAAWFLWRVAHLGEADFGNWRGLLLLLFSLVALGSFFRVRDFLAVRGAAVLVLLAAGEILDTAYMRPEQARLVLVTVTYLGIVASLFLGASPYLGRDACLWLERSPARARGLGAGLAASGLALLVAAATYAPWAA